MGLHLTGAFSDNPRVRPLLDGTVKAKNIDLDFVVYPPQEIFDRNLKYDEFDLSEMSISDTLRVIDKGDGSRWDWSGLPVFMSKAFLWYNICVNTSSGVGHLGDLRGKRLGTPDYANTASIWMRVMLQELYGIQPGDITWYTRPRELGRAAEIGLAQDPPPGITLNWLKEGQTLEGMLEQGDLDAAFGFVPPHPGGGGNPAIRRLMEDGGRGVTMDFFQKTGVIPVNHVTIVQNRVLREHPWVAIELYRAFQQSKQVAYERAKQQSFGYLLFEARDFQEQAAFFGEDPFPMGIKANEKMLNILFKNAFDQGLTKRQIKIEEVFYSSILDT